MDWTKTGWTKMNWTKVGLPILCRSISNSRAGDLRNLTCILYTLKFLGMYVHVNLYMFTM